MQLRTGPFARTLTRMLADDPSKLKHSGLLSVQLQPPGTVAEPAALPAPSTNGKTAEPVTP